MFSWTRVSVLRLMEMLDSYSVAEMVLVVINVLFPIIVLFLGCD